MEKNLDCKDYLEEHITLFEHDDDEVSMLHVVFALKGRRGTLIRNDDDRKKEDEDD